ncbi:hypothetical protein BDR03DRAFT_1007970 [Suillus americanus]|nr:hypothetical protein BDR03DRAFT_1007970 [Suillus americanus]
MMRLTFQIALAVAALTVSMIIAALPINAPENKLSVLSSLRFASLFLLCDMGSPAGDKLLPCGLSHVILEPYVDYDTPQ